MSKKMIKSIMTSVVLACALFSPIAASADLADDIFKQTSDAAKGTFDVKQVPQGQEEEILLNTISQVINYIIGGLGVVAVVLVVYAGYLWLTAGGNSGQIDSAKAILKRTVVGGIIVMLTYAIATFAIGFVQDSVGETQAQANSNHVIV